MPSFGAVASGRNLNHGLPYRMPGITPCIQKIAQFPDVAGGMAEVEAILAHNATWK